MSEYDEFDGEEEQEAVQPEVSVSEKLIDSSMKISIELKAEEITASVAARLHSEIGAYMRTAVKTEIQKLLTAKSYYQKEGEMNELMRSVIKEVVRDKFDQIYPDAVTNQVNKMVEEVKKVTLFSEDSYGNQRTITGLKEEVKKKVDAMVLEEIKPLVAEQAKKIQEQVQANFAQNFIKTMIPLGLSNPSGL